MLTFSVGSLSIEPNHFRCIEHLFERVEDSVMLELGEKRCPGLEEILSDIEI